MKNGFPLTLRQAQHERKSARPELVEGFFIGLLGGLQYRALGTPLIAEHNHAAHNCTML